MDKKDTPASDAPEKTPAQQAAPAAEAPATNPESVANPAPEPKPEKPDNTIRVEGVLDIDTQKGGNGQLLDLARYGKRRPTDVFVPKELIRRFKLRTGSVISGTAYPAEGKFPNPKMKFIEKVDGLEIDERRAKFDFNSLTTISPEKMLRMETKDERMTTRAVDLFCPVGKGTRGLIVAPPHTGKTTLLRDMALGVLENNPECHVMILLVDERPEEVTDFKRSVAAEIWASSNDEQIENHIRVADLCIERAKRLVETGKDVVLFLDSITRLARAHNNARHGGKTMSGGIDSRAMEKPRQLFAAARNTEEAGSLTIVASVLVETGSRMDDIIFQEFKGTGNMELVLDRKCAEMRLWPAINIASSGTRREELLIDAKSLDSIHFFRRALVQQRIEEATETMIMRLSKTKNNEEFLKLIAR
ncbi:transcription termination factor Rho [Ereboglobus luteus]|uniref:Transcription termination factor Rho n=1 Tax=Ereboglobus luteus TaxID=1796921 RepID=A0A2U8E4L6_9BACT|nr:transcription termination factor Rho [Ereboglobus luteus]AWI09791.1 transcription termination factor Rho [Ereboglobus luteus]